MMRKARSDDGDRSTTWVAERIGYREDGGAAATTYTTSLSGSPSTVGIIYDSRNTAGQLEKRYAKSGKSSSIPMLDLMYDYDAKGTITRVTTRNGTTASLYFNEETFTYDWLDRLMVATGPAAWYGTMSYTYDEFGNRLTETTGGTTKYHCYLSGGENRLDTVRTTSCGGTIQLDYDYDNEGRVTKRVVNTASSPGQPTGTWNFTYTAQGEIKTVDKAGIGSSTDLTFKYDGSGRRVLVQDYNGGSQRDDYFAYGGLGPLVNWTKDSGGTTLAAMNYAYAGGAPFMHTLYFAGPPTNDQYRWLVTDHLGSPRLVLDKNGNDAGRTDELPSLIDNPNVIDITFEYVDHTGDFLKRW